MSQRHAGSPQYFEEWPRSRMKLPHSASTFLNGLSSIKRKKRDKVPCLVAPTKSGKTNLSCPSIFMHHSSQQRGNHYQAKRVHQSYDIPQHGSNIHWRSDWINPWHRRLENIYTVRLCGIWREILAGQIHHKSLPNDDDRAKRTSIEARRPTSHGKKILHFSFQEPAKSGEEGYSLVWYLPNGLHRLGSENSTRRRRKE